MVASLQADVLLHSYNGALPEALSLQTLTFSTTWVQCSTFALFCVPDGAASMPDDEKATFRNNNYYLVNLVRASTETACPPMYETIARCAESPALPMFSARP